MFVLHTKMAGISRTTTCVLLCIYYREWSEVCHTTACCTCGCTECTFGRIPDSTPAESISDWRQSFQFNLPDCKNYQHTRYDNYNNSNIISYHIVVLKWQNRLKVGTDKPKLKVKMQSVSDDDVLKRFLEKPRFELAAKGVFRLGRCYIF